MDHVMVKSARASRNVAVLVSLVSVGVLCYLQNGAIDGNLFNFRYDNPYAMISLLAVALNSVAITLLTRRPARTDERIWLSIYLGGLILYGLGEAFCRMSIFPEAAIFWTTLSGVGSTIGAVGLFLFALAYTNQAGARYAGTIAALFSAASVIIFFYGFTNIVWNVNPAELHAYAWALGNDPGPGLLPVVSWFYGLTITGVVMMIRFRRRTTNAILRRQSLLFILALSIPATLGLATDGVLPALDLYVVPLAMAFSSLGAALLTYGILRYQLLTVNPALFSESILSIMHESVLVTDKEFKIAYTNAEANRILNIAGSDVKPGSLLDFLKTKSDAASLTKALEQSASQTSVTLDHIDILNDLKRLTPVRLTMSRLRTEDMEVYVLVLTDISAELQSKAIIERTVKVRTKQLHEARAYLLSSIKSLGQGFVLIDADGKIEVQNEVAKQSLAASGANQKAELFSDMVKGMHWDADIAAAVSAVLAKAGPQRLHATTKGGVFYDLFVTPVKSDDAVIGAAVVMEDVTERKILERSRDEFFSIASHELRTPLTAIRGNMSMMAHYFPDAMKDKNLAEAVTDTHDASVRLIAIVNDFLDSSRLEQGKMEFAMRAMPIEPLMKVVEKDLHILMAERGDTMTLSGFDKLPLVYADAARLQQIFFNVIDNAVKYTEQGKITITAEAKGANAHILISDSGTGISPENQRILFHKFQQASDDILTRSNTKGTGLGLYISKLLASNMGGDVTLAYTGVGRGSTFLVRLPLATAEQIADASSQPKA